MKRRQSLEHQIEATTKSIELDPISPQWVKSKPVVDFLIAWRNLADYYQETGDTTIVPETIRTYKNYKDLLGDIIFDKSIAPHDREQAQLVLNYLSYQYGKI